MVEMLIFFILLLLMLLCLLAELMYGVIFLVQAGKKNTQRRCHKLGKTTIRLAAIVILTGGFVIFSQLTVTTPPIKDSDGNKIQGSIQELRKVSLNGRDEWISIRGKDRTQPVLLFLAGGPGGSQLAAVRHDLAGLEEYFTVVVWEQPGSGKAYYAGRSNLTPNTYIEDGYTLTQYLCKQFNQEKLYLVGESWGSALGIFLASEYPDSYHAVIGTGQMIDFLETENRNYDKALAIARERNDTAKLAKLDANGRPPYYGPNVTWKSAEYLNYLSSYMTSNPAIHNSGYNTFRDIFSPEYGILDKINYLRGIVTTFNQVYPQLYGIDLRRDYARLEVPVYFFLGRHDINAPTDLVEEYVSILEAPHKEIIWFEHSGHSPWRNESDRFVDELLKIRENGLSHQQ